jgi:hypothetical protein
MHFAVFALMKVHNKGTLILQIFYLWQYHEFISESDWG